MAATLTGRCVCAQLQYSAKLASTDDARTSLCHCSSCKRAFGTNYGLTTKVRGFHTGLHSVATIRGGALISSHGPRSRWKASPTREASRKSSSRTTAWSGSSATPAARSCASTGRRRRTSFGTSCGGRSTSLTRCRPRESSFARREKRGCRRLTVSIVMCAVGERTG